VLSAFSCVPRVSADGSVSYISNPLASTGVPIISVEDDVNIEMVPYGTFELTQIDEGEVLSSSGVSPVSNLCTGGKMTSGEYTCSVSSVDENVSGSVFGDVFSHSCRIDVVLATYPMFFHGGDFNGDGRIDIYRGEWPSFSDVTGQLQPSAEFVNGEIAPGDEYHYSGAVNYPPDVNPEYGTDGSERTAAKYVPEVLSAGDSVDQQPSNPSEADSTLAFPQQDCSESPLESVRTNCASGRKAYNEWDMIRNPNTASNTVQCETVNGQSNCGMPLWYPDANKQLARPVSQATTCPTVDTVFPHYACLNANAFLFGWVFQFSGFIQNLDCLIHNSCMKNVKIMMRTESLLGSNKGCEEPCGDVYSDTLVASQRAPNYLSSCDNYGTGQNAPCWPDTYVGTPGLCRICGTLTVCTFVWKNWLKDNYDRQRTENAPCEDKDKMVFLGKTYTMCSFDAAPDGTPGYFGYVKAVSAVRDLLGVQ